VSAAPGHAPDLEGTLEAFPLSELLQFLAACRKSGALTLGDGEEQGELQLAGGHFVQASIRHLRGVEAAVALLGVRRGRFRFRGGEPGEAAGADLGPLLMETARLEDEFERHAAYLPPADMPLSLRDPLVPLVDELQCGIDEVIAQLRASPQSKLAQVERQAPLAPIKVRLAVAVLASTGRLRSKASIQRLWRPQPSTAEWYVRLLYHSTGCVRLLVGVPSDWPLAAIEQAIRALAQALGAEPPPLVLMPGGPSFVRLRPAAGGMISLTLLPLGPRHRYLTQSFVGSVDAAVAIEGESDEGFGIEFPPRVARVQLTRAERDDACFITALQRLAAKIAEETRT